MILSRRYIPADCFRQYWVARAVTGVQRSMSDLCIVMDSSRRHISAMNVPLSVVEHFERDSTEYGLSSSLRVKQLFLSLLIRRTPYTPARFPLLGVNPPISRCMNAAAPFEDVLSLLCMYTAMPHQHLLSTGVPIPGFGGRLFECPNHFTT